jgi:phage shock protein A
MYSESDARKALDRLEKLEKQVAAYKDRIADLEQRIRKLEGAKQPFDRGPTQPGR